MELIFFLDSPQISMSVLLVTVPQDQSARMESIPLLVSVQTRAVLHQLLSNTRSNTKRTNLVVSSVQYISRLGKLSAKTVTQSLPSTDQVYWVIWGVHCHLFPHGRMLLLQWWIVSDNTAHEALSCWRRCWLNASVEEFPPIAHIHSVMSNDTNSERCQQCPLNSVWLPQAVRALSLCLKWCSSFQSPAYMTRLRWFVRGFKSPRLGGFKSPRGFKSLTVEEVCAVPTDFHSCLPGAKSTRE